MILVLPILALFGALSPLLTLAWLWQIKEWRIDRLLEHLRREGWVQQLLGTARPVLIAIYGVIFLLTSGTLFALFDLIACLMLGALLTAITIVLGRQRMPVFTQKAVLLTATAGVITILLITLCMIMMWYVLLPFTILLQPLTLGLSWLLWHPVDAFLKSRIIARAKAARESHPDLTVIGVTGSVGKTTTKELLACVLKDLNPAVTPAHVNSEIGVAQWMTSKLRSDPRPGPGPEILIVEMGAYRKGEISLMSTYVQQTMAVVTHVGTQHIALFGSQQNLFEAKSELVTSLPATGLAFLNGDNELTRKMKERSPCPVTIVGTGGQCDLEAFDIEETSTGIKFRARETVYDVPLQGTHNVTNILLAIAVGETLGMKPERMRELLKTFTPLSGTFNVRTEAGVRILDDTHNSSAASVKAAIAWARNQQEKHKTLLAAGLIEMGEFQSPAEQELGGLASNVFDRIIVMDPQSAMNFRSGGATAKTFSSSSAKIPPGSLLVCTGRMAASSIKKILPK